MSSTKYARNGHAICAISSTQSVIVTGTRIDAGNTCEMLSIKENKWQELPELKNGRYYHSSCSFNDSRVFVFCGLCSLTKKYLDSIEFLELQNVAAGWQKFEII
jgi:hypothetical protein